MEALGLRTLASSLQNSIEKESSLNLGKQRNKKVRGEGSDSSEYLPGAEEGQEEDDDFDNTSVEKVSSQSWLGVLASRCPIYIIITYFPLCVRKLTTRTSRPSGVDQRRTPGCLQVE